MSGIVGLSTSSEWNGVDGSKQHDRRGKNESGQASAPQSQSQLQSRKMETEHSEIQVHAEETCKIQDCPL